MYNKEIAYELSIAEQTVKNRLSIMFRKLNIRNRRGLTEQHYRPTRLERAAVAMIRDYEREEGKDAA